MTIDEVLRDNRHRPSDQFTPQRKHTRTALHLTPGIIGCRCDEMGSSFDTKNVTTWNTNVEME